MVLGAYLPFCEFLPKGNYFQWIGLGQLSLCNPNQFWEMQSVQGEKCFPNTYVSVQMLWIFELCLPFGKFGKASRQVFKQCQFHSPNVCVTYVLVKSPIIKFTLRPNQCHLLGCQSWDNYVYMIQKSEEFTIISETWIQLLLQFVAS